METYCVRTLGNVDYLKTLKYNFFNEILLCAREQGIPLEVKEILVGNTPDRYWDIQWIKDLEDEIIRDLIKEKYK